MLLTLCSIVRGLGGLPIFDKSSMGFTIAFKHLFKILSHFLNPYNFYIVVYALIEPFKVQLLSFFVGKYVPFFRSLTNIEVMVTFISPDSLYFSRISLLPVQYSPQPHRRLCNLLSSTFTISAFGLFLKSQIRHSAYAGDHYACNTHWFLVSSSRLHKP